MRTRIYFGSRGNGWIMWGIWFRQRLFVGVSWAITRVEASDGS